MSKRLEIPVLRPEQSTDLTSVGVGATALKSNNLFTRGAVLGSSGSWELVLCLEQDAHLFQCWAVISLPSGSWQGRESAEA